MNGKITHSFMIRSSRPPIVEVDGQACAFYVRFKSGVKVARTIARRVTGMHLAVDVDDRGEVIGVEVVGCRELVIRSVLQKADVRAPNVDFSKARIVQSEMAAA